MLWWSSLAVGTGPDAGHCRRITPKTRAGAAFTDTACHPQWGASRSGATAPALTTSVFAVMGTCTRGLRCAGHPRARFLLQTSPGTLRGSGRERRSQVTGDITRAGPCTSTTCATGPESSRERVRRHKRAGTGKGGAARPPATGGWHSRCASLHEARRVAGRATVRLRAQSAH